MTKLSLLLVLAIGVAAQTAPPTERGFIPTQTFSEADDKAILKMFEGLRVADVSDGLDVAGLQDVGLVSPEIRPLWRDTENFKHVIVGIAVTVRYVPTNKRAATMKPEEFPKWESEWYNKLSSEPFQQYLRPGSMVVIDATDDNDTGSIGSNNILSWKLRGAVGVVTSGGARDTDEIIKQQIPLYYRRPARGIRPGRNEVESVQRPITVGGVLVRPGDIVVADGDGVVVVPREQAAVVSKAARAILEGDKAGRRKLYEKLGMPIDRTVK